MTHTTLPRTAATTRPLVPGLQRPVLVAGLIGLVYLGLLAWLWQHFGGDPQAFIHQGTIWRDGNAQGTWGYDGQFYYYIALHPLHAVQFLDLPTIRLQRIFYPLVIIAVSLAQRPLMPYAMLLINWAAVVGGTWMVAALLRRWGRSPWWALSYALASGIPVALQFDTAEPLAFALVIAGVACWEHVRPASAPVWPAPGTAEDRSALRWMIAGAAAFAAALLTRELAAYFVAAYAGGALFRRDWRGIGWALLPFVPVTLWGLGLSATLHSLSVAQVQPFEFMPFLAFWVGGNLSDPTWRSAGYAAQYIGPTIIFGGLALSNLAGRAWAWVRARGWDPPSPLLFAVLGNVHLLTFLPRLGYQHQVAVSRYALGLALAAVLWAGASRPRWLLWLTPLAALTLIAYAYGLITQDPAYLW